MGKKLYVGNLSYDVDNAALEQLFAAHGTVTSAQIIMDRDSGRSKGFGFVEMSSDAEAQAAITALNEQQHGGRALAGSRTDLFHDLLDGQGIALFVPGFAIESTEQAVRDADIGVIGIRVHDESHTAFRMAF